MGANNSTPNNPQNRRYKELRRAQKQTVKVLLQVQKKENQTDKVVEALESQKRMYEEQYEKLRQTQSKTEQALQNIQKNLNGNQSPNNNVCQLPIAQTSTPLYPNLNNIINNNAQTSTGNASPSTSNFQMPSNSKLSSALPTAPVDPAYEALSSATAHSVNKPRPSLQAQPGLCSPVPQSAPKAPALDIRSPAAALSFTKPRPQSEALPGLCQLKTQRPISQPSQAVPSTSSANAQSVTLPEPPKSKLKSTNFPQSKTASIQASIVECVTCNDKLGLTIYQCKNGHSSCSECRFNVCRCGRCNELITDMRNLALETVIADLTLKELDGERMKCPNSVDGCCLSLKTNEIEDHLKECPYREMACPLTAIFGICTWKGKINQIGMHFKELHQEHYEADVDKEMHLLNINVNHKIVYLVNLGAFHFVVHIEVNGDQKTICMTVQTLGTKFSASKWTYEFHVYNKREPRRKYKYIDTCSSNSESVGEIFIQKKCAVLNSEYAKTFLDNNKLAYKFYIKKNLNPKRNN